MDREGLRRRLRAARRIGRDHALPTYAHRTLEGGLGSASLRAPSDPAEWLTPVAALHSDHYFDLLGSGWVRVHHGMDCVGLEGVRYPTGNSVVADADGRWLHGRINQSNLRESQRLWQLVDAGYRPIDWQLDFKSGYRWSEKSWHRVIARRSSPPGADIKVPWELGRLHHLPILARAYARAGKGADGPERDCASYTAEFQNQVLDFIASNPPRFGVQWSCTMNVAIRAANLLVAYDIFRAAGASFDGTFDSILARSIHEHGEHIVQNLEWTPSGRGNHYLANVVGLLFIACYLPRSPEADAWLAFAAQEMLGEFDRQFLADGGNFEASTYYHCLSAEMVLNGIALLLGIPSERRDALRDYDHRLVHGPPALSPAPFALDIVLERALPLLTRAVEFIEDTTKPCGRIHQVGDTDSGLFVGWQACYRRFTVEEARRRFPNLARYDALPDNHAFWYRDPLAQGGLLTFASALICENARPGRGPDQEPAGEFARCLSRGRRLRAGSARNAEEHGGRGLRVGKHDDFARLVSELQPLQQVGYEIAVGSDSTARLARAAYPDFGLYIFRGPEFYLAIRCGAYAVNGTGGHAHNDQLAVELACNREEYITDPGSYLYTSLPERRQQYRSVRAHFAPRVEGLEPASLDRGLFSLADETRAECLYFGENGFIGVHHGYGTPVHRVVQITGDRIVVSDHAPRTLTLAPMLSCPPAGKVLRSHGYGTLLCHDSETAPLITVTHGTPILHG